MRAASIMHAALLAGVFVLALAAGVAASDESEPKDVRNTWVAAVQKTEEIADLVGDAFPADQAAYDALLQAVQTAMEGGLFRVVLARDDGSIAMDTGSDHPPGMTPGREWETPAVNTFAAYLAGTVAPLRPPGFDWTVDWAAVGHPDPYSYSRLRETEDGEATAVARLDLATERGVVIVSVVPYLPPPPPEMFGVQSLCPPCTCECEG